ANARIVMKVPAGAFRPPPKVESAVLVVEPREETLVRQDEEARFRAFVQEAFGLRRKQMRRVLRTLRGLDADTADAILASAQIDPEARPETLSPEDFVRLFRI